MSDNSISLIWNAWGRDELQIWNGPALPPIPVELERRPEERVGRSALLPDLMDLRRPQGLILGLAIEEIAGEAPHDTGGGGVGDAPEGGEDGTAARARG